MNLAGANFSNINVHQADFEDCEFLRFENANFDNCDLSGLAFLE